jgi:hypothetical protein
VTVKSIDSREAEASKMQQEIPASDRPDHHLWYAGVPTFVTAPKQSGSNGQCSLIRARVIRLGVRRN